MKRNIKKSDVKFTVASNADDTRDSFHGYYKIIRANPWGYAYESNAALCNKNRFMSEDGEGGMEFSKIQPANLHDKLKCQSCLKIFNKLEE